MATLYAKRSMQPTRDARHLVYLPGNHVLSPMCMTLTPTKSSISSTYALTFLGKLSNVFAPVVGSCYPVSVLYTTSAFASRLRSAGKCSNFYSSILYATVTGISAKPSKVSNLVRFRSRSRLRHCCTSL